MHLVFLPMVSLQSQHLPAPGWAEFCCASQSWHRSTGTQRPDKDTSRWPAPSETSVAVNHWSRKRYPKSWDHKYPRGIQELSNRSVVNRASLIARRVAHDFIDPPHGLELRGAACRICIESARALSWEQQASHQKYHIVKSIMQERLKSFDFLIVNGLAVINSGVQLDHNPWLEIPTWCIIPHRWIMNLLKFWLSHHFTYEDLFWWVDSA